MTTTADRHLEVASTSSDFDRTPPHDENAERWVLGAMMLRADCVLDVTDKLRDGDFYQPKNAELFRRIVGAYGRGEPTDWPAIAAGLVGDPALMRQYQNGTYLHSLVQDVPSTVSASHYAGIVAERAQRRRLIEAAGRIQQLAYTDDLSSPTQLADRAGSFLYEATEEHISSDVVAIGDLVDDTIAAIEEAGTHQGLRGLPTGFKDMDELTGGLQGGQFIIVAGRPGMGKSILVTDICRAVSLRHRLPALMFNLEMSKRELMLRIVSAETGIRHKLILSGQLNDAEWTTIARSMGDVADAPLYFDDGADVGLAEIRAKARRMKQRGGLAVLVVDYLQLLRAPSVGRGGRQDTRERDVAEMSRGLKVLAKELDIPVVAVAQLNRGPETRLDKTPHLSDLRESGSLEQDGDIVIFVHRPEYYEGADSTRSGEVDFIFAKHRGGPLGTVTAASQLHCQRFVDMARP